MSQPGSKEEVALFTSTKYVPVPLEEIIKKTFLGSSCLLTINYYLIYWKNCLLHFLFFNFTFLLLYYCTFLKWWAQIKKFKFKPTTKEKLPNSVPKNMDVPKYGCKWENPTDLRWLWIWFSPVNNHFTTSRILCSKPDNPPKAQ